MFCVALLAGWGLDDVTDAWRASRAAPAGRAGDRRGAAGRSRSPWSPPHGARGSAPCGEGFEVAWLFADPPGQLPQRHRRGRHPHVLADHLADARRRRARPAGAAVRAAGCGPVPFVVLAAAARLRRPLPRGHGLQPGDRPGRRARCPRPGRSASSSARGRRASSPPRRSPRTSCPSSSALYEARGYDFPIIERYDRLWRREIAPRRPELARRRCSTCRCSCAR